MKEEVQLFYDEAFDDGVDFMKEVIEEAIKRNRGARTMQDCVNALNDIIVNMHNMQAKPKQQTILFKGVLQ